MTKWGWESGIQPDEFPAEEVLETNMKNEGLPARLSALQKATQLGFPRGSAAAEAAVSRCVLIWIFLFYFMFSHFFHRGSCSQGWV